MKTQGPFSLRNIGYVEGAGGVEWVIRHPNAAGTIRLHPGNGNVGHVQLAGNVTIRLAPVSDSRGAVSFTLVLVQDAVGSRTVTWGSEIDWGTTGAPTLTTTASKADVVTLLTLNGGRTWYGFLSAKGFTAP